MTFFMPVKVGCLEKSPWSEAPPAAPGLWWGMWGRRRGDQPLPVKAALSLLLVHTHVVRKAPTSRHWTVEPTRSPGLPTPTPGPQRPLSIPWPGSPHAPWPYPELPEPPRRFLKLVP